MNFDKYDVVIVGAGLAGSTLARILADSKKKVLIIEKRKHIAGNVYDYFRKDKLLVQKYGPHIFHTASEKIWEFVNRFSRFFPFQHKVLGLIKGKLVPIPFNFKSIDTLFDKSKAATLKHLLKSTFPGQWKISIFDLLSCKNKLLKQLGDYIYENVFYHYTLKQWDMPPEQLGKFIIKRIPVILGYQDTYFYDKYQYMPQKGFTYLFKNMLRHKNITIRLNKNIKNIISFKQKKIYFEGKPYNGMFIYTGPIDELFDYKYGVLPYRSLRFVLNRHNKNYYQPVATVNFPNNNYYTRITEYKHFLPKKSQPKNKTIIAKEYPIKYGINQNKSPYYPINNKKNDALYQKYKVLAESHKIILCGRLAEYKYYTMEATISSAMLLADKLLK